MKRLGFLAGGGLLFLVLSIVLTGCQTASSAPALPDLYVTVTFVNNSGIAANRIHVALRGQDNAGVERNLDLTQTPAAFLSSTSAAAAPDVTLDTLITAGPVTIPYVVSARLYLGIDRLVADELANFTEPGAADGTIYDKVELTVKSTGNVVNLTQVDYFALPLKLAVGAETRGFNDGITRKQILDAYEAALSGGWEKVVLRDAAGNRLRILNPAKIAPGYAASFPELYGYWDSLINEYWAGGKTVTILTDETVRRQISGTADGSKLDFGADGVYLKPTTLQLFGQEVAAGSDAKLVKWVSGALNRGVIKNPTVTDQGDSDKFYTASAAHNGGVFNKFAEFFHNGLYTIDGRAYALAFDDVFGRDSSLGVPNKGNVTITLQAFE
ncbi:MAG: beta-1,3-glucanase family protein [Candidatus Margulisiibacteriota bacterium]